MKIILNINDAKDQRVIDAFVLSYAYASAKQPSETELAFTKRMIKRLMRKMIISAVQALDVEQANFEEQEKAISTATEIEIDGAIT